MMAAWSRCSSTCAAAGQRYLASGEGTPRYEGTRDGRALFTVGSGSTQFRPA
jgi:hypothetical protein